mmetsp:Transcript_1582/g.2405  ORF Transcript_1582/g.2405 Transcript_1582/m.2405 type:complete len:570 (-) Transcript_1582:55-1764(-)
MDYDDECQRCGGREFEEQGARTVCTACGLENVLGVITASDDWAEEVGRYQSTGGRLFRRRKKKDTIKKKKEILKKRIPSGEEALTALGHCFEALVNALIERCNAPERIRIRTLELWRVFAQQAQEELNNINDIPVLSPAGKRMTKTSLTPLGLGVKLTFSSSLNKKNPLQESPDMLLEAYHKPQRSGGLDSGSKRKNCTPTSSKKLATEALHTESLLPLLYLAIRCEGIPISAFDLERWSSFGSLPFMTMWRDGLDDTDRENFKDKPFFFAPVTVPQADTIAIAAELRFAKMLKVQMQPVDFQGLVRHFSHLYASQIIPEHADRLAALAILAAKMRNKHVFNHDYRKSTTPPHWGILGETSAIAILCLSLRRYFDVSNLVLSIHATPKAAGIPVDEDSCILRNDTEALAFFSFADAVLSPTAFYCLAPEHAKKLANAMYIESRSSSTLNYTASLVSITYLSNHSKLKTNSNKRKRDDGSSLVENDQKEEDAPENNDDLKFNALIAFFASDLLQCPASVLSTEIRRIEDSIDVLATELENPDLPLSLSDVQQARKLFSADRRSLFAALKI